jgi:hypothetical protein
VERPLVGARINQTRDREVAAAVRRQENWSLECGFDCRFASPNGKPSTSTFARAADRCSVGLHPVTAPPSSNVFRRSFENIGFETVEGHE